MQDATNVLIAGQLHVEVFMEIQAGETEVRQACLELQICSDPMETMPPSPASLCQIVVDGTSASYGCMKLEVQDAMEASLRVALIGACSQEATRIAIARLLAETTAAHTDGCSEISVQGQRWVALQWVVDERRTVHLRVAFHPRNVDDTSQLQATDTRRQSQSSTPRQSRPHSPAEAGK